MIITIFISQLLICIIILFDRCPMICVFPYFHHHFPKDQPLPFPASPPYGPGDLLAGSG